MKSKEYYEKIGSLPQKEVEVFFAAERTIENAKMLLEATKSDESVAFYLAKTAVRLEESRNRYAMLFSIAVLFLIASLLERVF